MTLNPKKISTREKLILTGMYLSKFGSGGLSRLGFRTFAEAYNAVGYALGSRPSSIKNYRDEFDPYFPGPRKGWHKREMRDYCKLVLDEYGDLNSESFAGLIKSFARYDNGDWIAPQSGEEEGEQESGFANRLITGLAAERYFESVHTEIPEFRGLLIENTTQLGCGYDFRLTKEGSGSFLVVEVKGIRDNAGTISLTQKEHQVANKLKHKFYLCVVKNFRKKPFHQLFPNPTAGTIQFTRTERTIIQVSWMARV